MKLRILIAIFAIVGMAIGTVNAQLLESSNVKVLPGNRPGLIKILYALESTSSVEIRFVTDHGQVGFDKVENPKTGFIRRYDVNQFDNKDYWIEITSADLSVTYHIEPTPDGVSFIPTVEKASIISPVVARLKK